MMAKSRLLSARLTLFLVLCALVALPAMGQVAKQSGNDVLSSLAFVHQKLQVSDPIEPLDNVRAFVSPSLQSGWEAYKIGLGTTTNWNATIDRRTGLVSFAEGGDVAWIPGRGNKLTAKDLGGFLKAGSRVDMTAMEAIARGYLPRVQAFLGVNPKELVLNRGRSGQPADHVWFVDFDVVREGLAVEGARVVFRVNNGNLIQYGTEGLPTPGAKVPVAKLAQKDALDAVAQLIGGFQVGDTFRDAGSLHLLPVAVVNNNKVAEGFEFGKGRELAKVWQLVFHRDGVMGTWRARVDAATGEVLELADINDYVAAQATGGTYLNSPTTGSEVVRPMPFTNLSTGGFANSAGVYNFAGGALTSTLSGQYVGISDTCGAISKTADAAGNLAFGTSTGTDCVTPGSGGAGNTHASREQFYQVNRIKEVGRGWLPSNTWLQAKLTVNVNLNQTCNAYWNGSTLNFFKSGGGCRNTGELAGVSLHEYGHGLDQNDGTGTAPEGGTGEAYGDITAAIALHTSCIGPGFLTSNCGGYGNACTACTGVRDIDSANRVTTTPATVSNFTQVRCGAGSGPCGKEVHCESYVPSQTIWDLANRDLPGAGTGPAWTILDRLWYVSRNTATSSFTCSTGTTFTSNGCGAGNWWKVMRAVDDDDGNLSNGTPHGAALFAAFNRHGIACTTDAGASTSFSGCTAPAVPTLSITPGDNAASLSWSASGSAVYGVFRNEAGCNAGFAKVSSGSSATALNDVNVANGLTYFYQVTAYPSGNEACASAPSTCISVTPVSGPATPDFAISASPASVSIAKGAAGSSTITSAISNGFNSAIALSASGVPAGVTVSLSPSSIAAPGSGSSTLSITVSSTAVAGTSTITVTGTGGSLTRTTTVTLTVTNGGITQLLGNPGFENGSASPAPWTPTAGVVDSSASEAAHSGTWKAWLNGYGTTHTDSILQTVAIPSTATTATLAFWLHIDTAETTTVTAFDTLKVQIRNTVGTVLSTLATYSNLNKATGFTQKSFDVTSFKGQTVQVFLVGTEDSSLQTSFVVDDFTLNVQ